MPPELLKIISNADNKSNGNIKDTKIKLNIK